MESNLSVVVRQREDAIVLMLSGELDMASSPQLADALDRLRPAPRTRLELDLRELGFIDVSGLRTLLRARERARRWDGELILLNIPNSLRRLVHLTGTADLLEATDGR